MTVRIIFPALIKYHFLRGIASKFGCEDEWLLGGREGGVGEMYCHFEDETSDACFCRNPYFEVTKCHYHSLQSVRVICHGCSFPEQILKSISSLIIKSDLQNNFAAQWN